MQFVHWPLMVGLLHLVQRENSENNLPLSTDFSSVNAFKRFISKTDLSEYLKYDVKFSLFYY